MELDRKEEKSKLISRFIRDSKELYKLGKEECKELLSMICYGCKHSAFMANHKEGKSLNFLIQAMRRKRQTAF